MKPDDAMLLRGGARSLPVRGVRGGTRFEALDWIAEEVLVALEFNGISHAVMLATPLDLADFALGFSLSEGILQSRSELYGADEEASAEGITLKLEVASAAFARLKDRRRTMTDRTGCGLCGAESLAQLSRPLSPLPAGPTLQRQAIAGAMTKSRASFAMVQKAVVARVPLLAAASAPTTLAIATAEAARLTLVGFARGQDLVVYAHPERLAL